MEYMMNIGANRYQRGLTRWTEPTWASREPRRALVGCAYPGPPPVPIFWYIGHFDLEKEGEDYRDGAPPSRGETWAGALLPSGEAIPPRELPLRGGNHRHHHHQQLPHIGEGNVHQHLHQHHLLSKP